MFASPDVKRMVLDLMTDSQYYCESCEQCGLQIQDNNIAEVD